MASGRHEVKARSGVGAGACNSSPLTTTDHCVHSLAFLNSDYPRATTCKPVTCGTSRLRRSHLDMPIVLPLLKLSLAVQSTWDAYKALRPPRSLSERAIAQRKRSMKAVLSVWVVWVCHPHCLGERSPAWSGTGVTSSTCILVPIRTLTSSGRPRYQFLSVRSIPPSESLCLSMARQRTSYFSPC